MRRWWALRCNSLKLLYGLFVGDLEGLCEWWFIVSNVARCGEKYTVAVWWFVNGITWLLLVLINDILSFAGNGP